MFKWGALALGFLDDAWGLGVRAKRQRPRDGRGVMAGGRQAGRGKGSGGASRLCISRMDTATVLISAVSRDGYARSPT